MTRATFALLLPLALSACPPVKPPVVVPPATQTIHVEVYDLTQGVKVPGASVRYWYTGLTPDAAVTQTADAQGNTAFVIPATVTASHMWVSAEGYVPTEQHIDATPSLHVQFHLAKPPPPVSRRHGVVRLEGRALRDDDGYFLGHGATLFWGLWGYQHDRARLEENLAYLAESHAIDHVRVLATVGGASWADRAVDPRVPGYDETLAGLTDLAYDTYGLRLEWTVFGGVDFTPTVAARAGLVDRVLAMTRGREHKVILLEVANEGFQTGFGGSAGLDELRALTWRANQATSILVAASSYHEDPDEFCLVYWNSVADVATIHFDRETRLVDGVWRPVRQPWGFPGELGCDWLPPGDSNEPIGPYSSVAEERDPTRLIAQVLVAHVAGLPLSVIHAGPGIRGGGKADTDRGIPANFWEADRLTETLRGLSATTARLPADLPAWSKQNSGWAGTPFGVDNLWPDGGDHGAVRVYSATRGQALVTVVVGVKQYVVLTARWATTVDVIRVATGEIVQTRTLAAGETLRLEEDLGAWLMVSR